MTISGTQPSPAARHAGARHDTTSEQAPTDAPGPAWPQPVMVRREAVGIGLLADVRRPGPATARDLCARHLHLDGAPDGLQRRSAAGPASTIRRTLSNIEFSQDPNDNSWFISKVVADRSAGTGGGAHATAYGVFVDSAIYAVNGKSFEDAMTNLLALCDEVVELPEFTEAKIETPDAKKVKDTEAALARIKSDPGFQNLATKPDMVKTQTVERLFREYLDLRNGAPGVIIPGSSGTKGVGAKNERAGIDKMTAAQEEMAERRRVHKKDPTKQMATKFGKGAWLAFDESGLTPTTSNATKWARDNKVAIANHLVSCGGYPESGNCFTDWSKAFVGELAKKLGFTTGQATNIHTVVVEDLV